MNRNKNLPLTETTYYIILSLLEPGYGYVIMEKVKELSNYQVKIAAGTLYGAIENLLKQKLIKFIATEDNRRKVYVITEKRFVVISICYISNGSININLILNAYKLGLWKRTGEAFWGGLLFETPFALVRDIVNAFNTSYVLLFSN